MNSSVLVRFLLIMCLIIGASSFAHQFAGNNIIKEANKGTVISSLFSIVHLSDVLSFPGETQG